MPPRLKLPVRLLKIACIGLSIVPLVIAVWTALTIGRNFPLQDEWEASTPVAINAAQSTLSMADMMAQNNEHRILLTHMVTSIVTLTTHWQLQVEMLIGIGMGCLTVLFLFLVFRRQQRSLAPWFIFPLMYLVFTPRDFANVILAFQTQVWFVIVFLALALWALYCWKNRTLALIVAAFCATCTTFSFSSGFLLWPILLVILLPLGYRHWSAYVFWIGAALFVIVVLFLPGYMLGGTIPPPPGMSLTPNIFVFYVLIFLGNPFMSGTAMHITLSSRIAIIGILVFIANVLFIIRVKRQPNLPLWRDPVWRDISIWFALAAYSVGTASLAAVGRWALFVTILPNQPTGTRYVIHSVMFWIAVLGSGFQALTLSIQQIVGARRPVTPTNPPPQTANESPAISVPIMAKLSQRTQPRITLYALALANIVGIVTLVGLYIFANNVFAKFIVPIQSPAEDTCVLSYPFRHDEVCLSRFISDNNMNNVKASIMGMYEYRLGAFYYTKYTIENVMALSFAPATQFPPPF